MNEPIDTRFSEGDPRREKECCAPLGLLGQALTQHAKDFEADVLTQDQFQWAYVTSYMAAFAVLADSIDRRLCELVRAGQPSCNSCGCTNVTATTDDGLTFCEPCYFIFITGGDSYADSADGGAK